MFNRYSRTEKAIENAIVESYIQGVSTRKVENIVAELGVENISKSRVLRIAKELDEKVYEFINKPMFIVAGVNEERYREVLGVMIADSEDAMFWQDFFSELKQRGLDGVELVISDGHKGIQKAIVQSFIESSWQMCHVHFMRAVLSKVPKKHHKQVTEKLKEILEDENKIRGLV